MRSHRLPFGKLFLAAGIGLSGTYVACVLLDRLERLVPGLGPGMTVTRIPPLPAFAMLNLQTFLAGLAMSFLSGGFFVAWMVPLYNAYFSIRDRFEERGAARHGDRLRYF